MAIDWRVEENFYKGVIARKFFEYEVYAVVGDGYDILYKKEGEGLRPLSEAILRFPHLDWEALKEEVRAAYLGQTGDNTPKNRKKLKAAEPCIRGTRLTGVFL